MKKEHYELICDACGASREVMTAYGLISGWAEVQVKIGAGGHSEVIHMCERCWQEGKSPRLDEKIPMLIRKFFGWTVKQQ